MGDRNDDAHVSINLKYSVGRGCYVLLSVDPVRAKQGNNITRFMRSQFLNCRLGKVGLFLNKNISIEYSKSTKF